MDKPSVSRLRMYVAVLATLREASPALATLPARLQLLESKVAQIYELAGLQQQKTEGRTARRDEVLRDMIDLTLDVAGAVLAHAGEHGLTELTQTLSGATPGRFKRLRIPQRPIVAQQILETAGPVVAELAPYGVTAATLADLQARIELAKTWLDQPRDLIRAKAAATAQLAEVFRAADALLENQIDRMLFPFRKTHPDIYASYQRSRQVITLPRGRSTTTDTPVASAAADLIAPPAAPVIEASPALRVPYQPREAVSPRAQDVESPSERSASIRAPVRPKSATSVSGSTRTEPDSSLTPTDRSAGLSTARNRARPREWRWSADCGSRSRFLT